jgi:hypothetical protein
MRKTAALVITLVVVFCIAVLILALLQPSSQEDALASLTAADKTLDQLTVTDHGDKIDEARSTISGLHVSASMEPSLRKALAKVDDSKLQLEADKIKTAGTVEEIRSQLSQARKNLSAPTASERARAIKDQLLALIWPFTLAGLVIYLFQSGIVNEAMKQMAGVVTKLKIPGALEIAFAGSVVKKTQEEVFRSYREQVIAQFDAVAAQNQISETLSRIVNDRVKPFVNQLPSKPDFRCTVHVRDALLQGSLYQLIDYLPAKSRRAGQGGKGRAWSARYGMIGRCWRLEKDDAKGKVSNEVKELINDWGMTKFEAERASGRQSILCHVIKATNQSPVGVFYMDAEPENAFGDTTKMDELLAVIKQAIKDFVLDKSLERVWEQIQASAPLIEIYADPK